MNFPDICAKCKVRPMRKRPGYVKPGAISFCMHCARLAGKLEDGDYAPEPEGFNEFIELGIKGPHGLLS